MTRYPEATEFAASGPAHAGAPNIPERESTMTNTSPRQARNFWSIGRKVLATITMASAMMTLTVSPALADRDGNHARGDRHGRHSQQHWRGDHDGYRHAQRYLPTYRQPYYYAQPVYVPPPVYYDTQRSPGISLFFPLDLRR